MVKLEKPLWFKVAEAIITRLPLFMLNWWPFYDILVAMNRHADTVWVRREP